MRLLIEAHHPAHIHFFKHAVRVWLDRGHAVLMVARDRDVMRRLLEAYDWIPSQIVTRASSDNRLPVLEMLRRQLGVGAAVARFRPDVVLSVMGSYAQTARLFRVPNLVFTDSEHQAFNHRIAHPFATHIHTPECFWKDLGPKQRRYAGYHELAFLHPSRFVADPAVLEDLGHAEAGGYAVLRVSAWNTLHDVGKRGFGASFDQFMSALLERLPVFIAAEGDSLPSRWAEHALRVAPHRFHDVLAHARVVVTEGASTASESACLGVPAVYVNPIRLGYLQDQERRYGLVRSTSAGQALAQTLSLLDTPRREFEEAQERLLADHIDVTQYVLDEVDRVAGLL